MKGKSRFLQKELGRLIRQARLGDISVFKNLGLISSFPNIPILSLKIPPTLIN